MKTFSEIINHLEASPEFDLIVAKNGTMTSHQFLQQMKSAESKFVEFFKDKTEKSIIVKDENPLAFFAIVFAAIQNNIRVCFPTKKFMSGDEEISFAKYILSVDGDGEVSFAENTAFKAIPVPQETEIIVFSSGSTGTPKGILHCHDHFVLNANAVNQELQLKSSYCSLTFLKPYLVSAYCHFLVHIISKSTLYFSDFNDTQIIKTLGVSQPQIGIIGAPLHLVAILKDIPDSFDPLYFFSSGDFLHSSHIKLILGMFPSTQIFKVYGLAELAGRFFIKKIDKSTNENEYDHIGEVLGIHDYSVDENQLYVTSQSLFYGYIKDGEFIQKEESHPTGDLVEQGSVGLELKGRKSDEYKVGGNKVGIKNLEKKINPLFPEDQIVLVPTPNPLFGNLINFLIRTDNSYEKKDIIARLRTKLETYEVPHQFFYIKSIPYGQSFKIDRRKIAQQIDGLTQIK